MDETTIDLFDKIIIVNLVKDRREEFAKSIEIYERRCEPVMDAHREHYEYLVNLEKKLRLAIDNGFDLNEWRCQK